MYHYHNGNIVAEEDMRISPRDLGLLRAYGVFDFMTVYNRRLFNFDRHFERLTNSCKGLGLELGLTKEKLKEIIELLREKNDLEHCYARVVVTGGVSENGITRIPGNETVLILIHPYTRPDPELYTTGAQAITKEFSRDYLPQFKTLNYVEAIRTQPALEEQDAIEVVYVKDGDVYEGSRCNVFIVQNGTLITRNTDILQGLTRGLTLDIATREDISYEERIFSVQELFDAQEVFITANGKDILPIVVVDGKNIGEGNVGEITKLLMEKFREQKEQQS